MWPASQNPYSKICNFPYSIYDQTKNLQNLFTTVTAGTVALNIIFEGLNNDTSASSKQHYPIQDLSIKPIPYLRPQWPKLIPYYDQNS